MINRGKWGVVHGGTSRDGVERFADAISVGIPKPFGLFVEVAVVIAPAAIVPIVDALLLCGITG